MKLLVSGSSGHLGEALVRQFRRDGHDVVGLDLLEGPGTTVVGSVADRDAVARAVRGVDAVVHTATLHKPHVGSHAKQEFVDANVKGTLTLLEASVAGGVGCFVFTSTTSTFGRALRPAAPREAVWVTEELRPVPRNIYGVTKTSAEELCLLFHQEHGLPCVVLRTSRFFLEEDDQKQALPDYSDDNLKANEYLYRRVDLEDVVSAHELALQRASGIGFGTFVISATTPFAPTDCAELLERAPAVVGRYFPDFPEVYARAGFKMFPSIGRVYVNDKARAELGWRPRYDFRHVLSCLREGAPVASPLARSIGRKGYHRGRAT